jgi:hypothetical protein
MNKVRKMRILNYAVDPFLSMFLPFVLLHKIVIDKWVQNRKSYCSTAK